MSAEEAKETDGETYARLREVVDLVHVLIQSRGITKAHEALAIGVGLIMDICRACPTVKDKAMVLRCAEDLLAGVRAQIAEAERRQ